jgi:hypothetical protein
MPATPLPLEAGRQRPVVPQSDSVTHGTTLLDSAHDLM